MAEVTPTPPTPTIPDYRRLGLEVGKLVNEKQLAYGDSFGKAGSIMKILYPEGITIDKMDDALCVTRILDKLFRLATQPKAFGESPYRDIAGYALLGLARHEAGDTESKV